MEKPAGYNFLQILEAKNGNLSSIVKDYIQKHNHNNESNNITIHHYYSPPSISRLGSEPRNIIAKKKYSLQLRRKYFFRYFLP